jgi:predicted peptidase
MKRYCFYLAVYFFCIAGCTSVKETMPFAIVTSTSEFPPLLQRSDSIKSITPEAFEAHIFSAGNGMQLPFRYLEPKHIGSLRKYPLVIVFHGSGAVGMDNKAQVGVFMKMWASEKIRANYPAFVIAPQFPERSSNYSQDSSRNTLSSYSTPGVDAALELIDSIVAANPNVNKHKVYVMGFSMGASTTVNAMISRPDFFAAGVAYAGIPNFQGEDQLMNMPLWIIHGNKDFENPFQGDSLFYKEMSAKGARKLRFWELDKVEHEITPGFFATDEIPKWFFKQRKK